MISAVKIRFANQFICEIDENFQKNKALFRVII